MCSSEPQEDRIQGERANDWLSNRSRYDGAAIHAAQPERKAA